MVGRNGVGRRLERVGRGNGKSSARVFTTRRHALPLPGGEGRGEGELSFELNTYHGAGSIETRPL